VSPEYVLNALAWSLGGFALGYTFAAATRDLHSIKEACLFPRYMGRCQP